MTRTLKVLIAVTVVLFLAFAVAGNTRASEDLQIVRVTLKDYRVEMSQFVVTPGKTVQFLVANDGSLAHKFGVQPYVGAGAADLDAPVIAPGTTRTIQHTFTPGVYRVACAGWDHAERGMVNALAAQVTPQKALPMRMDLIVPVLALVLGSAYILGDSLGLRLTRQ